MHIPPKADDANRTESPDFSFFSPEQVQSTDADLLDVILIENNLSGAKIPSPAEDYTMCPESLEESLPNSSSSTLPSTSTSTTIRTATSSLQSSNHSVGGSSSTDSSPIQSFDAGRKSPNSEMNQLFHKIKKSDLSMTLVQDSTLWINNYRSFDWFFYPLHPRSVTDRFIRYLLSRAAKEDSSILALSGYCALALSALRSHRPLIAKQFHHQARQHLALHFDSSDYHVAECLLVLGVYIFYSDIDPVTKYEKCSYYLTLAISICTQLKVQHSNVYIFSIFYRILLFIFSGTLTYSLLTESLHLLERHVRPVPPFVPEAETLTESEGSSTTAFPLKLPVLVKTWDAVKVVMHLIGSLELFRRCAKESGESQQLKAHLLELETYVSHIQQILMDTPPPIKHTFTLMLYAAHVGVARAMQRTAGAVHWSEQTVDYVQKNDVSGSVCGMVWYWLQDVVETLKERKEWEKVRSVVSVLESQGFECVQSWKRQEEEQVRENQARDHQQPATQQQRRWFVFSPESSSFTQTTQTPQGRGKSSVFVGRLT